MEEGKERAGVQERRWEVTNNLTKNHKKVKVLIETVPILPSLCIFFVALSFQR